MSLPPLPESNTARFFSLYLVGTEEHSYQVRAADSVDDATAVAHLAAQWAALQPTIGSNVTFVGVEKAASGSNVRNIIGGTTPLTGTGTAVSGTTFPFSWTIAGRAPSGRKARVSIFGVGLSIPSTYKQDPLTDAGLQGFQGLLNSQSGFNLAIDGTKPTWYFRATVNANDHWVKIARI